jgi:hypothetical protein
MTKRIYISLLFLLAATGLFAQGFGIPSKHGGIGFGNLKKFTGLRFNYKDHDVEKIVGVNVTVWTTKHEDQQTGTMTGIAIGLPMAMGVENQRGISVGLFGAGAVQNLSGINIGGLGVGAGGDVSGFNFGGLGVGSGGDLNGVNIGGLGAGSGGDVRGFSFGGLGVGAGGSLSGISIGGLGVGSGGDVSGLSVGGIGVGSGEDITGVSGALVGVGAGGRIRGITVAGVGVGSGEGITGLTFAVVGIGSPKVNGIAIASVVGGDRLKGIIVAPGFLRVGDRKRNNDDNDDPSEVRLTGLGISAFNRVMGEQRGVTIGAVNYAENIKGVQFGIINIVKSNPKGLRVLPIFNTRFGKKGS